MKQALAAALGILVGIATVPFAASAATATSGSMGNRSAYELVSQRRVVVVKRRGMHGRHCTVRKRIVRADGVRRVRTVRVCR